MAWVGYARVSSVGQSREVQRDKLIRMRQTLSGNSQRRVGDSPQLRACLDYVREGDTLVVTRLDRRDRSTGPLCRCQELRAPARAPAGPRPAHRYRRCDRTVLFNMPRAMRNSRTELTGGAPDGGSRRPKARGVRFGKQKRR